MLAKSHPLLEDNTPLTFSQIKYLGLLLRNPRMNSQARDDFAPASPLLLPAIEKSWQGIPPVRISKSGTFAQSIFVISTNSQFSPKPSPIPSTPLNVEKCFIWIT